MTKEKKERAGLASKLSLPIAHWDTIYFILNEANTRWRRGNMRYHGGKKNILRWKGPLPSQEALSKSKIINLVSQGFLLSQYCSSTTSKCIRKTQAPKSTHYQKHSASFTFTCKRLCTSHHCHGREEMHTFRLMLGFMSTRPTSQMEQLFAGLETAKTSLW